MWWSFKSNRGKQYDAELIEEGYNNIVKYGITFYKRTVWLKEVNNVEKYKSRK